MADLNAEQWTEVGRIFARALELSTEDRARFLERDCSDPHVREEVTSLLSHASGALLERAGDAIGAAAGALIKESNPDERMVGARLGPYRLISIAGYGGMGAVYRARRDDGEFQQQVAIKLVRSAAQSTHSQQKFRQERDILANLSHPNICRLLDGGSTAEGVPYLVMEFIEGEPITTWCDSRGLGTEQRLRTFLPVCAGAEAVNRGRVIHRDLKPANILVTRDGVPKVLDFGISKLQDADGSSPSFTTTRFQALTPQYAAPEQVRGEAVTAATDVCALGLVLYELLTGRTAQNPGEYPPAEVERLICTADPVAAAALNQALSGDLDNIIKMAIRKEPGRRYPTPADLGEDIRRHLAGHPVLARPDTLAYRASKFLTRNRVSVKAATASAVLAGIGLTAPYIATRPPKSPKLQQVLQLTQAARVDVESRMATDGVSLYFTQENEGRHSLAGVPVAGGTPSPVPLDASLVSPKVLDISPDKSSLLLAAGVESNYSQPLWIVSRNGGSARQVGEVSAWSAAWSRDGRSIFFIFEDGIYRIDTDGSGKHKLVDIPEGSYDLRLAPSPQRERLRFAVFKPDMLSSAIFEVNTDGSQKHLLLPASGSKVTWPNALYSGDWIASGRYYMVRTRQGAISSFWAARQSRNGSPVRSEPVRIYSTPMIIRSFTPSGDGARVFFAAAQSRGDLVRYDSTRRQFLPFWSGVSARGFNLSRSGADIVYSVFPQETLWRVSVGGGAPKQLTTSDLRAFGPRWSPDGKHIAFTGGRPGQMAKVQVIPAEGGVPRAIDPDPYIETNPAWSPDGRSILVSRTTPRGAASSPGLYNVDLQTGRADHVPGSNALTNGVWSPDARYITAVRQNADVMLLDTRTNSWSNLAHGSGIDALFWSHDSKCVIFQDHSGGGGQAVFRVRISNANVRELMNVSRIPQSDVSAYTLMELTADDSPIAYVRRNNSDIYALDLDLP